MYLRKAAIARARLYDASTSYGLLVYLNTWPMYSWTNARSSWNSVTFGLASASSSRSPSLARSRKGLGRPPGSQKPANMIVNQGQNGPEGIGRADGRLQVLRQPPRLLVRR